jgi:hypothetical protein
MAIRANPEARWRVAATALTLGVTMCPARADEPTLAAYKG